MKSRFKWLPTMFGKIQIQKQLYVVFFLTVVTVVLLMGSFLTYRAVSVQYQRAYDQLESDNLRARSILFDATLNFYNITEELLSDKTLQAILTKEYPLQERSIEPTRDYSRFDRILKNNTSISSLRVYTTNTTIGHDKVIQNKYTEKVEEWFEQVKVPGSIRWESSSELSTDDMPELLLIRSIPLPNSEHSAIVVMSMSNNFLKNRIQNNRLFLSLSINKDPIFFSTIRKLQGTYETAPIDYDERYFKSFGDINYLGDRAFSFISTLTPYQTGETIYLTSLDFAMPQEITYITALYCGMMFLAILLPYLIIRSYARNFSTRVDMLKNAMHHAREGNYDIIDNFQGDDELSVTFEDLKGLIVNIKEQQTLMYEAQIKEQELTNKQQQMEFKLLSSQINPHFIYNTLETIRMMAIDKDNAEIAQAVKYFAQTMRYVLENTGTTHTTLSKELEYIQSYLAIQKLRFFDKIDYSINVSKDIVPEQYQILPLLIQPLVENAITHGLADIDSGGKVCITIHSPDHRLLLIDVEDNGKRMNADEIKSLYRQYPPERNHQEHIGIYNIMQRIQMFYGEGYGLEIKSEEMMRFTLRLPLLQQPD